MKTQKQFVNYEIAKALKELGFNEECLGHYISSEGWKYDLTEGSLYIKKSIRQDELSILAQTWQQAIDWLRDNHNIVVRAIPLFINKAIGLSEIDCYIPHCNGDFLDEEYDTYYKAQEIAIKKGIEEIFKRL
jgi:hypothetical protein